MSKRSRRQFLEDSMLVAAAAVATNSAGPLLAADEPEQSKSPNEKLGVAVIGVKGRGGSHIGAFAGRKDTEILYVCDVDRTIGPQRAGEIAKRQNGRAPVVVEDIRKLLEDKNVDIVSIATPNHWHSLGAIWAMQAGKDVYVEKPVSHNVSEGRRCVEAARKYGRICQTGTQSRSNPGMIEAMEYVQSGKIGQLKVARGLCYKRRGSIGPKGEYPIPDSINYDLWCGPAKMLPLTRKSLHYDWHWMWEYGNGDLGNQGIHQMDLARWGMGVQKLCNGVISYGGRFGYEDAGETANTQVVVHDYGDKSLVFEVRGLETKPFKGAGVGVIFEGTDGYVVMTTYHSGAAFDKDGNKVKEFKGEGDHFANFLTAVRSRKIADLNADIEEGHLSSALCHLGNISYRLGAQVTAGEAEQRLASIKTTDNAKETWERTVQHLKDNKVDLNTIKIGFGDMLKFDPDKETFPDSGTEKANAMLTRDYRAPFVVPAAGQV
jgi:predicted dehydrogenase